MASTVSRKRPGRSYRQNDRVNAFQIRIAEPEAAFWSCKVIMAPELDDARSITDGEIAIINLESARKRSWSRFFENPTRDKVAETVVEHEQLTLQFVGDVFALDRVEMLAAQLVEADASSARTMLIRAQVA